MREPWWRGLILGMTMLLFWTLFGAAGFMLLERWSFPDGLYMAIITISTVGYSEVHPLSPAGRLFTSCLIVVGLGTAIYTLTRLGQVVLEGELVGQLGRSRMQRKIAKLRHHHVLCGFGRFARPVAEGLSQRGEPFCVIDTDPTLQPLLEDLGYLYLIGDATSEEVLQAAGIVHAQAILALLPSDADNLYVTVTAKALNARIAVIARAVDEKAEIKLKRGGATDVVAPYKLAAYRLLQAVVHPAVVQFIELVSERRALALGLGEARIVESSVLSGMSIAEAQIRQRYGVLVIALKRANGDMLFNPEAASEMVAGDTLVMLGREDDIARIQKVCEAIR